MSATKEMVSLVRDRPARKPARDPRQQGRLIALLKRYAVLYLLLVVPVLYLIIYRLFPMVLQLVLAFKQYTLLGGIWGSPWVGFANFAELFGASEFQRIIRNTVVIAVLRLLFGFFPPIILAVFLYDMGSLRFKRLSQSILYIPHFFSWVVVYAIVFAVFSNEGFVNSFLFAGQRREFLVDARYFYPLLIGSGIWKELGWGTIIYLAALSGINIELFEAAKLDGAGPVQRLRYVTLPGILPVIVFVLTLSLGTILSEEGTEQILLFYTPATFSLADVMGTWVVRRGLGEFKYSLGAAVSFFRSIVGLTLVVICNKISTRVAGIGIW